MTCQRCANCINETISKIDGIKKVGIKKMGSVHVEYDLMRLNIKMIENEIINLGYGISTNLWQRVKRGWIHYSEETESQNMNLPAPPCCSKPPIP